MTTRKRFWWSARGLLIRSMALFALGQLMLLVALMAGVAGLGSQGFLGMIAVFVAVRLLHKPWLVTRGDYRAASREVAGQIVLVMALFGIGALVARVTGWQPAMALWQPLAVAGAAGLLMRLIWRPMPPEAEAALQALSEQAEPLRQETP